ncbi:hypothetical protein F751_4645 [Auxenochlorella protothecoides]|nr:hypothetical protein F751_4645 [Auxenochlorella protothecoides]KFM26152.1 hypothetical protein F751_4645 [Auxenochlorella protothecoides]
MAALDDQVARRAAAREKDAMDAAEAHRRAAADWALKAAMEEEREQEKLLMYKAGEAQLLGQLAERREAAAVALAANLAEGTAQRLAAERLARQEVEGERERRAAGAALLEEVAAFNALRLGRKEAAQRAQRAEDEAIVRFNMEKDAQEQDEREATELAKEEAAEALKAQSKSAQLATMKQQLEYKAEAAKRAAEEEAAEAVKEAKKKAAAAALRTTLQSQLRELAALTEAGRFKEVQEAQAQAAAAEAERNALERLKQEKLALLSHVPAKYRVDLERLQVA